MTQNERAAKTELATQLVLTELLRAQRLHKPLHSSHEGIAVIEEEFIELRDEVFAAKTTSDRVEEKCREAIELAAMGMRFLVDTIPADVLRGVLDAFMRREQRDADEQLRALAADAATPIGGESR